MEKKKLLLVAVSVGIFLIIVIGLSILIFLPKNKESQTASRFVSREDTARNNTPSRSEPIVPSTAEAESSSEPREPATVDAVELLRNREDIGGLQPPPAPLTVAPATPPRTSVSNNGSSLVIEVPRPSSAAIPNSPSASPSSPSSATVPRPSASSSQMVNPNAVRPTVSQPASSSAPSGSLVTAPPPAVAASRPAGAAAVSVPSAPAPRPIASTRARENYWVQVGSFSTQVRAEDAKEALAAKGITAIIVNRDVNGQNFFRVRIGPYTSQNEADYWVARIKNINGFENSQIWQSQSEL
ncbi:MAG: SPOR domain-containing protein [Spirochaetaceae bacterium]|nr:SPOR domain-containing protein [Spirochaetaceae bacterium]